MLKSRDLNKELKTLEEKGEKATTADVVKALCLIAKVVRDIKTNQVLGLRKAGVELIQPDTTEDKGKTEPKVG